MNERYSQRSRAIFGLMETDMDTTVKLEIESLHVSCAHHLYEPFKREMLCNDQ